MTKQPTSVRWDDEKLNLVKDKEKLNSVQKVFTFLLDKYWWEHKVGFFPIQSVPTNNSYETPNVIHPPKPKIVKSQSYFEKQIINGFDTPEEHRTFIQELNESDLPDRIKQNYILASRTKQS